MKMELKARYQTMSEVVADLEDYQVSIDPAAAEARAACPQVREPGRDAEVE